MEEREERRQVVGVQADMSKDSRESDASQSSRDLGDILERCAFSICER